MSRLIAFCVVFVGTMMNDLLTASEAANKLNVTIDAVHKVVREDKSSCGQITFKNRFAERQLEAFIDSHWRA
jgi:hypothetical protein